ncbi:lim domain, putative [Entamoeba invadens IP1]|uniref:lim domain, putative n=1 Tax=Entamoeba invadens IP1 TaxID=370355 RepID=UPI0002C3D5EA|nr:lim domain, putative [Entamoeba invadens IP1]ELP90406.1 lim domain, putative [Entamoeba invadens IP1]|eukprot:XP_004257177.1 lim domain, putative [Entamoeba invadens IP1]
MPIIKIKVKQGTANKIVNVERTLPNIHEVFVAELKKKYPNYLFDIVYKGDTTPIIITDNKTLTDAIDHCVNKKEAFLQLEAQDKIKEEPKPKEEPKKVEPKEQQKKEEPKPKADVKKEEPKKTEPKKEEKKEEPKTPAKAQPPQSPEKQSAPKFCPNCGVKLNGSVKFCSECGAKIGGETTSTKKESEKPKEQEKPATIISAELCAKCGKPVAGGIKAIGKFYHEDCFVCTLCGEKFGGDRKIMEHNGDVVCSLCYEETYVERCYKCGKPLVGKYLVVDGHNYHDTCFVCSRCGEKFSGSYMITSEGLPVCKKCA